MCFNLPSALATAKKGTSSMCVDLLTGPWPLGLYHTTLGTPFLSTTLPPQLSILFSSFLLSGLWSVVNLLARHL